MSDVPPVTASRSTAVSKPLGRRVATAAAWAIGMRVTDRVLGVVSTFILARLLLPADYGIVAMAMVVITFVETIATMGIDSALISKRDPDKADFDSAWTLNAAVGVVISLVILACAYPAAIYFRTPDVALVVACLALMPLFSGFENTGMVEFRRQLQFGKDAFFGVSKRLVGLGVTIPLAFMWRSYWALIAGMVTGRAVGLVLSFVMSAYRPSLSVVRAREIFRFSKWVLVSNVLAFLRFNASELMTGRFHGAHALGLLKLSMELASIPSSELVMPVNRALFPGYAKLSEEPARLRAGFLKALSLLSLLSVPASVGLALVGSFLVPLLLGPAWLELVPVLELLALSGVSTTLQINNLSVFLAVRRPDLLVKVSLVHIAALVVTLLALVPSLGAIGAAWSNLVSGVLSLPVSYFAIANVLRISFADFAGAVWRPVAASAVMWLTVSLMPIPAADVTSTYSLFSGLISTVVVGAAVYAAGVTLLWWAAGRPESGELVIFGLITGSLSRLGHARTE